MSLVVHIETSRMITDQNRRGNQRLKNDQHSGLILPRKRDVDPQMEIVKITRIYEGENSGNIPECWTVPATIAFIPANDDPTPESGVGVKASCVVASFRSKPIGWNFCVWM